MYHTIVYTGMLKCHLRTANNTGAVVVVSDPTGFGYMRRLGANARRATRLKTNFVFELYFDFRLVVVQFSFIS